MSILESFKLTDRVAVVTGGAGLLGAEFARTLAEAGAAVVIVDLNASAATAGAAAILELGGKATAIATDITSPESVAAMVHVVLSTFGRLDILVNSAALDPKFDPAAIAGGIAPGGFEDYPLDLWNAAMKVNLTGTFLVTQACVKPMVARGQKGSIVNICSTYGLDGPDQRIYVTNGDRVAFKPVDYPVTKAGVMGFTRYLAAYYAGTQIRVNALTPGGVFHGHEEAFVKNYSAKTMLGRMARRHEMNGALLFLASDASSYMTGSNVVVDGGWTAW
ncbi:MAG: SDR family oxidoreductase [Acidobacteria bacterium]|nr:SDR family oxidoreductase [Acidobacteriota bacterium]